MPLTRITMLGRGSTDFLSISAKTPITKRSPIPFTICSQKGFGGPQESTNESIIKVGNLICQFIVSHCSTSQHQIANGDFQLIMNANHIHLPSYVLQKSKRGKVASRPSQEKQLARLQEEEREYQRLMKERYASSSASTTASTTTTTANNNDIEASSDITVPEEITDRMLKRMVLFSGGPIFLAIVLFPLFYYLKKVQDIDVPTWLVYIVQTTAFGGGLLGISYGILSSSWDPRREGSLSGWNEFQANLPLVFDRFKKKE